jgi:hypothetical protein
VLQVAALPPNLREPNGQPQPEGWELLKRARKRAMFMGIIGAPSTPEAEIASEQRASNRRNILAEWEKARQNMVEGQRRQNLAEVEMMSPTGSQNHHYLTFTGALDMADDLAVTFQLAAEGELGAGLRERAREDVEAGPQVGDGAARRWTAPPHDPRGFSRKHRRRELCQLPSTGGVAKTSGSVQRLRRRVPDVFRTVAKLTEMRKQNEEILQGEWPSVGGKREGKYAVIALDKWEVVHLMAYWPGEKGRQLTPVEEAAACLVADAHRRGQGLLLTVDNCDIRPNRTNFYMAMWSAPCHRPRLALAKLGRSAPRRGRGRANRAAWSRVQVPVSVSLT